MLKLGLEEELGLPLELKLGLAHRQGERQRGDTPPNKIEPKRFDFRYRRFHPCGFLEIESF